MTRKRFIKLMMAYGCSRNNAAFYAGEGRSLHHSYAAAFYSFDADTARRGALMMKIVRQSGLSAEEKRAREKALIGPYCRECIDRRLYLKYGSDDTGYQCGTLEICRTTPSEAFLQAEYLHPKHQIQV